MLTLNGVAYKGGSTFKKNFTKPFAKEHIAKICANSWGVSASQIIELWDEKGNDASAFGTAIHNLLEKHFNNQSYDFNEILDTVATCRANYNRFKDMGAKITKSKKGATQNYARPSHPILADLVFSSKRHEQETILKKMVADFILMMEKKNFLGDSVQEPLVSYSPFLMGGFVDRLLIVDWDRKICRVQDYKINVDINVADSKHKLLKQFKDKDKTKLAGHTIQLNYYAYCLHMAGWTVEGLDLLVLDKDWKHYEVQLYDMDWFGVMVQDYNLN